MISYSRIQKTLFGRGAEAQAGLEAEVFSNKILIVYGGGSVKRTGLFDRIAA